MHKRRYLIDAKGACEDAATRPAPSLMLVLPPPGWILIVCDERPCLNSTSLWPAPRPPPRSIPSLLPGRPPLPMPFASRLGPASSSSTSPPAAAAEPAPRVLQLRRLRSSRSPADRRSTPAPQTPAPETGSGTATALSTVPASGPPGTPQPMPQPTLPGPPAPRAQPSRSSLSGLFGHCFCSKPPDHRHPARLSFSRCARLFPSP